jgi:hypothetical protein
MILSYFPNSLKWQKVSLRSDSFIRYGDPVLGGLETMEVVLPFKKDRLKYI